MSEKQDIKDIIDRWDGILEELRILEDELSAAGNEMESLSKQRNAINHKLEAAIEVRNEVGVRYNQLRQAMQDQMFTVLRRWLEEM